MLLKKFIYPDNEDRRSKKEQDTKEIEKYCIDDSLKKKPVLFVEGGFDKKYLNLYDEYFSKIISVGFFNKNKNRSGKIIDISPGIDGLKKN